MPAKKILVISRPRSGSTAVMELLGSHPKIQNYAELLNLNEDPNVPKDEESIYKYLNEKLENEPELCPLSNGWPSEYRAFKIQHHEKDKHDFKWDNLIRYGQIEAVIVVWRKNIVEAIASGEIAVATGKWYARKNPSKIHRVHISKEFLEKSIQDDIDSWTNVFESWPIEIRPVFVQYEEIFQNPDISPKKAFQRVFRDIGLKGHDWAEFYAKRQNPAPIERKILNWSELPKDLRERQIDLPKMFDEILSKRFGLPREIVTSMVPDREPIPPCDGFKYRVAEPYMPKEVFENVEHALKTGNISSASCWPKKLSEMLCKFFDIPVAIPCANGFISLVLALQAGNIEKGDEVIVPSLTMIAVPNAVAFYGGKPIFIDVEDGEYNPSWNQILEAITPKTKAVIVSHTYGSPAKDTELIAEECKKRGIVFIEDISEAVGISTYTKTGEPKLLGTFGDFACASMYVNKMLHAGDGGFILAKNPLTHTRLQSILNHGFTRSFHFVHFESSMNGKMNGMGAAVACGGLQNIQTVIERRSEIAKWYRESLEKVVSPEQIELMPECGVGDTPWVFGLHCTTKSMRTALRKRLAENGIETRDYFFPMHLQPAFRKGENPQLQRLKNSEKLGSTGFYLPTHTNLTQETAEWIGKIICEFFGEKMESSENNDLKNEVKDEIEDLIITGDDNNNIEKHLDANLSQEKTKIKGCGEKILRKASKCFNGSESWDDKKKILSMIKNYFETPLLKSDSNTSTILAFQAYFTATMNLETVPKDDEKLEVIFPAILKSTNNGKVEEILYFQKYDTDDGIEAIKKIKTDFENVRLIEEKIPENGYHMDFKCLSNKNIAIINLADVTLQEASKLIHLYETKKLRCETLILLNSSENFLQFLSELTKHFSLQSKHENNIRVYKALPPKIDPENVEWDELQTLWNTPLPRKLKFVGDPEWDHHHKNAYQNTIDALKERFHDDDAEVLFISAVEQYICDNENSPKQPWIGIIHGISHNERQFYVPDLEKLCTKLRFKPWLKRCVGLFTLTSTQVDYLKNNLSSEFKFPIQQLFYPSTALTIQPKNSSILEKFNNNSEIDIYFIGSFDRDFDHFFNAQFPKNMKKVLLECDWETPTSGLPEDVRYAKRADSDEYERILLESIVFLSLKNGGAANTLVIECITRNVPIVAPKMNSVIDYIGEEYPLLYEPGQTDFKDFLTLERVEAGIKYLKTMDKSFLTQEQFIQNFEQSSILSYIQPMETTLQKYDLTLSICSWKRTHNLAKLLDSFINHQTYSGSYEIIIWNNNDARRHTVQKIIDDFKKSKSNKNKKVNIELISSTENHVCSVRFAVAMLMRSEKLLICDDDIIPGPDFIKFFMDNHAIHPEDVLCVRGNKFLPHQMPHKNVHEIWTDYDAFKFLDDHQDESFIHYIHADSCLIPKSALLEVASTQAPDNDFMLVDDYWLSYVLAAKFDRNLRKLKLAENVLTRTEDSDQIGVAMYTRKDVANARTRMYIHHMTHGWPQFEDNSKAFECEEIKQLKINSLDKQRIGININSEITDNEISKLVKMNISLVRIGTAGVGRDEAFEFSEFRANPKIALDEMEKLVKCLSNHSIDVVIVLDKRVANEKNWKMIAERLCHYKNVVGYDLINEPASGQNDSQHWHEIRQEGVEMDNTEFIKIHMELIKAIRSRDKVTPIIIETLFWANIAGLRHLPLEQLKQLDDNLVASIHYYLPQALTWRSQNNGRYTFPGDVPIYENREYSETFYCSQEFLDKEIESIKEWTQKSGIRVFIGEFGITRDVQGADLYLKTLADSCTKHNVPACLYAYRDPDWEAMDYELGVDPTNYRDRSTENSNPLYSVIQKFNIKDDAPKVPE